MEKSEIVEQTKLAFDFTQRLYLETSYLIKEIEGILKQEEEDFQILRPGGYAISTARSGGLESASVEQWLTRKGVVLFAAKSDTELKRGQTITRFTPNVKLIIIRFVLYDRDLGEPEIWAGVVSDIVNKKDYSKFEHYVWKFAYYDRKLFQNPGESAYEDNDFAIKLNLLKKLLYSIGSTEDIQREIITPVLTMYRSK